MFALDHLALWTDDRDGLCARIAELTGLPILDGFQPNGEIVSRGVRFAGGPFLDIFQAPQSGCYLGLAGSIEGAEAVARLRGWRVTRERRPPEPTGDDPPWDILYLSQNGGVLSRLFIIDYSDRQADFDAPSYCGALHKPWLYPEDGPRLTRVWFKVRDLPRAEADLAALGYDGEGDYEDGRLYEGPAGDIVLLEDPDADEEAPYRFDIEGALMAADEPFGETLRLTAGRSRQIR